MCLWNERRNEGMKSIRGIFYSRSQVLLINKYNVCLLLNLFGWILLTLLLIPGLGASRTVRANKPKHWNLEKRKVYCKAQARRMGGSNSLTVTGKCLLKNNFIYLFIFGCAGSSLLWGFSLVVLSRGSSSLRCLGFSLWCLLWSMASRHMGSVVVTHRL